MPARVFTCYLIGGHSVHRRAGVGMTMVEVMITSTIMVVAIGSLMTLFGQQHVARNSIDEQRVVTTLIKSISTRLQSARWDYLGTTKLPWSYGRYQDTTNPTWPPLSIGAADVNDDLIFQGLLDANPNLKGLKVYIEWYRGVDATDDAGMPVAGELGLLSQVGLSSTADFRTGAFVAGSKTRIKPGFWLTTNLGVWDPTSVVSPTECVGTDPLAVRIVVSWIINDKVAPPATREFEIITARSP